MRVTTRAVTMTSLQGLNRNLAAMSRLQEQLTSGKLITAPSDNPTGTNTSMQTRTAQRAADQHARNITDGQAWINQTDGALSSMEAMTHRVRDLALQGKNTGTLSAASAKAIAAEVAGLREALLGVANQKIHGRPMFGGVTGDGTAYDSAGAWVGDDSAPLTRRISATETVRIDLNGPETFGPPGDDLFAIVDRIAQDVISNPAALGGHLDALEVARSRMVSAHTDLGARQVRLDAAEQIVEDMKLALGGILADTEDIDMPQTIMELEMQKVGYQAALAATAKSIQPSLMDFLR